MPVTRVARVGELEKTVPLLPRGGARGGRRRRRRRRRHRRRRRRRRWKSDAQGQEYELRVSHAAFPPVVKVRPLDEQAPQEERQTEHARRDGRGEDDDRDDDNAGAEEGPRWRLPPVDEAARRGADHRRSGARHGREWGGRWSELNAACGRELHLFGPCLPRILKSRNYNILIKLSPLKWE